MRLNTWQETFNYLLVIIKWDRNIDASKIFNDASVLLSCIDSYHLFLNAVIYSASERKPEWMIRQAAAHENVHKDNQSACPYDNF